MSKFFRNTEGSLYGAAMLVGVVVFLLKFTAHVLNPYNFDWLLGGGDDTTEYISWLYYRSTPWAFPVVGTLTGYDYPTVTGVGLTGAIPLIAIPMKLLTYGQTTDFQYFGGWFLACYVLQGYFSVRLLKAFSTYKNLNISPILIFLGSIFFILSPALLTRTGHINLCSQWLILWAFSIYFESKTRKQAFISYLKIVGITALIHQYLLLMMLGIAFAAFWRLGFAERKASDSIAKRLVSVLKNGVFNAANLGLAMSLWFFIGNFNVPMETMQQHGFGKFSSNLNVFFNGQGEQKLFKTFDFNEGQYEGYGYLGLGILLVLFISWVLILIFKIFKINVLDKNKLPNELTDTSETLEKKRFTWFSPLGFIAGVFALYAFSQIWTFGHETVLTARKLYESDRAIVFLSQSFRASGRFIWVMHYFLMLQIIGVFFKLKASNLLKISVLASLLLIQIIDVSPMVRRERNYFQFDGYIPSVMTPKIWENIIAEADRVVMLPPFVWHYNNYNDYYHFAHLTALRHKDITTGYLARGNAKVKADYADKMLADIAKGDLGDEQNSVFIASTRYAPRLKQLAANGKIKVFEYQKYIVGVPLKMGKTIQYLSQLADCQVFEFKAMDLTAFLKTYSTGYVLLAVVKDEAKEKLCDDAKKQFLAMNSDVSKIGFRGSYAAIFVDGKAVFDHFENDKAILETFKTGQILRGYAVPKEVKLESAGGEVGNFGRIILDKKDLATGVRGFNFLVLDKQFKILKIAYFDTYDGCETGEVRDF